MKFVAAIFLMLALSATGVHAADIALPTKAAKLEGQPAYYDDATGYKCIRHWRNTNITARWTFDVPAKSAYRVFLTYACPPDITGSGIEVTVGPQRATGFTQSTGGWNRFKEFDLGPVLLRKPGQTELVVRITSIVRGNGFDLQSVRLVPEN